MHRNPRRQSKKDDDKPTEPPKERRSFRIIAVRFAERNAEALRELAKN